MVIIETEIRLSRDERPAHSKHMVQPFLLSHYASQRSMLLRYSCVVGRRPSHHLKKASERHWNRTLGKYVNIETGRNIWHFQGDKSFSASVWTVNWSIVSVPRHRRGISDWRASTIAVVLAAKNLSDSLIIFIGPMIKTRGPFGAARQLICILKYWNSQNSTRNTCKDMVGMDMMKISKKQNIVEISISYYEPDRFWCWKLAHLWFTDRMINGYKQKDNKWTKHHHGTISRCMLPSQEKWKSLEKRREKRRVTS